MNEAADKPRAVVERFNPETAKRFQEGKIIAQNMVPQSIKTALIMDWVVISKGIETNWEQASINKIFSIVRGSGKAFIGDDVIPVGPRDVVWCPADTRHHFAASDDLEFTVVKWNS